MSHDDEQQTVSDEPAKEKTTPGPPPPPRLVELLPAWERFDRGDFRGARALARALIAAARTQDVEKGARDFLAVLAPDPWAVRFGLLALALLVLVTALYVR
jgi:hypothetical protein